jgi:proton-translocating NADH-quinone oxidoreductase chain M
MVILIGVWGSRSRRVHASYLFFLYTLVGSLIMLLGVLTLYFHSGSTNWFILVLVEYPFYKELFIWLTFFISFAVKVPIIPFHIWLPEAHVEAPTAGSVLLAGILLKMGTYAFLRFLFPLFPFGTEFFIPLVFSISVISILYSSLTTIRQIDLKKIIAYSSVAHMNFVTLGLLSLDLQGLEGSVFMMLGHGLVSPALFLCVGVLYDRYHTRLLPYFGGLVLGMPLFSIFFFIFTLANVSLPGTINFVGEFLILISLFSRSLFASLLALIGVILGAVYAMWLFNRVVFGLVNFTFIFKFSDLNKREFLYLFFLLVGTLCLGFFPNIILHLIHFSSINILLFFI